MEMKVLARRRDVKKLSEAVSIVSARVYSKYRMVRILDDADVDQERLFAWRKRDRSRSTWTGKEGRPNVRVGPPC